MAYRLARALEKLRSQVNAAYPERSKVSDGWIGDAKHASTKSDHNPWVKVGATGVVTALDLTHDPKTGPDAGVLAETLRVNRDPRVKYIISNGRIAASYATSAHAAWEWRPYTGVNAHRKHVHLSVRPEMAYFDSIVPWQLNRGGVTATVVTPTPVSIAPPPLLKRGAKGERVKDLQDLLKHHGHYAGKVDSDFGPATENALRAFQKAKGLDVDGKAGPLTWGKLKGVTVPPVTPTPDPVADVLGNSVEQLERPNPEIAMDYFQLRWERHQAAAIVGHAQQESYKDLRPNAVGDAGKSFGIFQWNGSRQDALKAFALKSGLDYRDLRTQLAFVEHELATTEKRTATLLRNSNTVEEAVKAFMGFERPTGFSWEHPENGHGYANRLKNAEALFK